MRDLIRKGYRLPFLIYPDFFVKPGKTFAVAENYFASFFAFSVCFKGKYWENLGIA